MSPKWIVRVLVGVARILCSSSSRWPTSSISSWKAAASTCFSSFKFKETGAGKFPVSGATFSLPLLCTLLKKAGLFSCFIYRIGDEVSHLFHWGHISTNIKRAFQGQIRCKRWFCEAFLGANFSISSLNLKELKYPKPYYQLRHSWKTFLNGKQSEVPVNHSLKGRPFKRVTYKANKTKRTNLYISQGKSADSFTISVKDEQGNLKFGWL